MNQNISRRDFLKGVTAGAAGMAAAGILGACSQTTDASSPETIAVTPTTVAGAADSVRQSSRHYGICL